MRRCFALAFALALAAGCSSAPPDEASRSDDHTEGEYVHAANHPFLWTKDAEHKEMSFPAEDLSRVLPADTALTKRLQAWADRIDDLVRVKVSASGERLIAPKPILMVLPTATTFNAWVGGVFVCLGVPFTAPSSAAPPETHALLGGSYMSPYPMPADLTCRRRSDWPSPEELVRRWPDFNPYCSLSLEDGKLTSPNCAAAPANDTTLIAIPPYIHFTTRLLASVDEKTMVGVMAHELGHYYRAHGSTLVEHKYQFWYEQDPALPGRPVPSDKQLQLQRTYQSVLQAPKAIPIDGSAYHARMHKLVALLAEKMKTKTDPAYVCKDAVAKTGDWATGVINPGPGGLTPAMTDGYLAFERELVTCAPNLFVEFAAESANLMDAATVVLALDAAGFDTTDGIPGRTNLQGILAATKAKSTLMDTEEAEMREKLRAGKVGLYTTEQEADDISLDVVTKLGITAGEMLGGWIKFMRAIEESGVKFGETESGDLGSAKCKALLDANFTEPGPDGQPVPAAMTLGSLESRHHGECYRAYNLWRENNGHKYEVTETFTPPAGPAWGELALEAAKLSGMVPSTEKTPPADATTPPADIAPADLPQVKAAEEARRVIDYPRNATTGCNAAGAANGSSWAVFAAIAAIALAGRRRRR